MAQNAERTSSNMQLAFGNLNSSGDSLDITSYDLYQLGLLNTTADAVERIRRRIQGLDPADHKLLMDLFWLHYNTCVPLIDKHTFLADSQRGFGDCYSPVQHLAMLATGARFAGDKSQFSRARATPNQRSVLHQELKDFLENEQYSPDGVPHNQAVLLLADLEYSYGAENTARTYISR